MKSRITLIFLLLCSILLSQIYNTGYALSSQPIASSPVTVYADGLSAGWENWSYGDVTLNLANASPPHSGSASAAITYTGGWSAFQIGYHNSTLDVSAYDTFRFWVHGGAVGGQSVHLDITDQNGSPVVGHDFTVPANAWTQVDVSLLSWAPPRHNFSIVWFNNTAGGQPTFYLDDVSFIDTGATPPPPPPPVDGPNLSVDAAANRHSISPYIYGMNFADEAVANAVRLPVDRWGGNATTRYNWQTDVTNRASDYYFINVQGSGPRSETDLFVEQDRRTDTKTMLTVSLIGWTPKDGTSCAYDTTHYPTATYPQTGYLAHHGNTCGTGTLTTGGWIPGSHPEYASMPIDQTFASNWILDMVRPEKFGTAAQGGVLFYSFDNEVGIWNYTHHDVHPDTLTYNEIRDRTYLYGAAVKAADPTALTLGPVEDGWCRWFFSAADECSPYGADYTSHGSVAYVAWYLQQMQAYELAHGVRILDYFDLHIYPQANGIFAVSPGNAATQALRLRSTRQLWDPTYVDESWIGGTGWEGGTVRMIPRMRDWVNNNYPGTKLAITEYNWGALQYMNGALAQADVLGIFGREGLDLATLWISWNDQLTLTSPATFAFRMYRNYDGNGNEFGNTSVNAVSANQDQLAIYAAQRASDNALTLMIINKTDQARNSDISLANFTPGGTAQVYYYGPANLGAIVRAPDQSVTPTGFSAQFPANTITLVVIPDAATEGNSQTFRSTGSQDGWVLESTETSNTGGSANSSATTFRLGDDAADHQYRAILSFDTASLPDNAVITKVKLKIKQSGTPAGANPFTLLGALRVDIHKPYFSGSVALAKNDFQAAAGKKNIGNITNAPVSNWYTKSWSTDTFFSFINRMGTTQFRLYFAKDDNNDNGADYMKFFSGNHSNAANHPTLVIEYYIP